jgi:hypothetical protein
MLFATLKANGDLIVRGMDGMEVFALKQWQSEYKAKRVNLVIETEDTFDLTEITKMIGGHMAEFQEWHRKQEDKTPVEGLKKEI